MPALPAEKVLLGEFDTSELGYFSLAEAAMMLGLRPKTLHNRLSLRDPRVMALKPVQAGGATRGARWRFPVAVLLASLDPEERKWFI